MLLYVVISQNEALDAELRILFTVRWRSAGGGRSFCRPRLTSSCSLIQALSLDADCRVHGRLLHDRANQGLLCCLYILVCTIKYAQPLILYHSHRALVCCRQAKPFCGSGQKDSDYNLVATLCTGQIYRHTVILHRWGAQCMITTSYVFPRKLL